MAMLTIGDATGSWRVTRNSRRGRAAANVREAGRVLAEASAQPPPAEPHRQLGIRLVTEQVFLHLLDHIEPGT